MKPLHKLTSVFSKQKPSNYSGSRPESESVPAKSSIKAAEKAMVDEDWPLAARLWNDVLKIKHYQPPAKVYTKLLRCLRKAGDMRTLENTLPKALSAYPTEAKVLYEAAAATISLENWSDAETLLRQLISQEHASTSPQIHAHLAIALRAQSKYDQAEAVLDNATAKFPTDLKLATAFIELAAIRGDESAALTRWRDFLSANDAPLPPKTFILMSRTLRGTDNTTLANTIIRHGYSLYPENSAVEAELIRVTLDRQGAPHDMAAWERNAEPQTHGSNKAATTFHTSPKSKCTIIKSPKWRSNPRFIQTCAYGTQFSIETATQTIQWANQCRHAWLENPEEKNWHSLGDADKLEFIRNLLDRIIRDALSAIDSNTPLTMGLSGGMDSRGILSSLRRIGASPQTFTFGQIGYSDFDFVSILKERESLNTILFDTSELEWKLDEIEAFAPYTQSFPVSPRVPIDTIFNQTCPQRLEINGWLGDALTKSPPEEDMHGTWLDSLPVFNKINNRYQLQCFLPMEEVTASLPQFPLLDPEQIHPIDQLSIGFAEYQRIRPVNRPNVTHIFPFAEQDWVGFWLNRTPAERCGQALWLRFLKTTGPREFFELQSATKLSRSNLRAEMETLLYGDKHSKGLINLAAATKALPAQHHTHFCQFTCSKNNPSYKRLLDFLIARLKKRGIFEPAFIDDVVRHFFARGPNIDRMLDGLLSIDVMMETGYFD